MSSRSFDFAWLVCSFHKLSFKINLYGIKNFNEKILENHIFSHPALQETSILDITNSFFKYGFSSINKSDLLSFFREKGRNWVNFYLMGKGKQFFANF